MKTKLLLFSALAFVILCFNGCSPDTVENTNEVLVTQDSIDQMLSQLQGTWYMSRQLRVDGWFNCDGLFSSAYTENRTTNTAFSDFKFIFTQNAISLSPGALQFNFSGQPHSNYFRLQVNGYNDYYAISKSGDYYYLYNDLNNAGWSYSMSGKHSLAIYGDTAMVLYQSAVLSPGAANLFIFKKTPVNETPQNIAGLNGTYMMTSKEEISSGVTTYVFNWTNGSTVTFTDEIVAPDISTYSYIPGAYKGVWYKATFNGGSVGPALDYIYCLPNGEFCFSTSEKFSQNNNAFMDVGNAQFEIVTNDGTNLTFRKGGICSYTEWHFVKVV